ncbi:C40 family peptidase [Nocardioides ferulae]|uniref:C40 family peptidase n=1 Tax=Nocardioides ferulae TaxID=2340821 RepID=UPI000F86EDF6|nr:C40 family peptidase [Nocardioides ferulae]
MRLRRGAASVTALGLIAGGLAVQAGVFGAIADPGSNDPAPSRAEVRDARADAVAAADDVEAVQAQLVLANQRLQAASIAAAQAAEAYNGARWEARQARRAATAAERAAGAAAGDVERQQDAYADALVTSYQTSPGLAGLSSLTRADGISDALERLATMRTAEDALDGNYDEFRAAAVLAEVSLEQAAEAREEAERAASRARAARDAAAAAADAAAGEASVVAAEKDALIARLAQLQDISVALAERRQSALEAQAAEAAAAAAQAEAEQQQAQPDDQDSEPEQQAQPDGQDSENEPSQEPSQEPAQAPEPAPAPEPQPQPAPAPGAGAPAAIAFARAQLGEPYRWAAAGPAAWDCSGLTMGAWAVGGKGLPHYSVAQYEQSTPIGAGDLRPGDLVFWGSSSSPSSIYHVALYVGGGRIIHAPRTGRPVTEESMYYWIPPNFHARP